MPRKSEIPREYYEAAYKLGRAVYEDSKHMAEALTKLEALGLNRTSATFFISNLSHMLKGEVYKRAMSVDATDDFLQWINRDYKTEGLRRALSALRQHMPFFRQSSPSPMRGHEAVAAKYQALLEGPLGPSALSDLSDWPEGTVSPDRASRTSNYFPRDPEVRAFVIKRAKGRCEYCGRTGFELPDGRCYVEAHHVIGLAKNGPDTVTNVIALCPEHHREAHFGVNAEDLEAKFIVRLKLFNQH